MIYLLYGSDTYRSREKLREIVTECWARQGNSLSFERFDAEEDNLSVMRGFVETRSLFGGKKLCVVERALTSGKQFDVVRALLERSRQNPDVMIVLWDGELNEAGKKRRLEIQHLVDKTQECATLQSAELKRWILKEAQARNVSVTARELADMLDLGDNLWAIANELEKKLVSPGAKLRHEYFGRKNRIYEFGDLFFTAPRRALADLPKLLEAGQSDFELFSYLAGYCRTLLVVQWHETRHETVPASHKINPFVAKKARALIKNIPVHHLRALLENFFHEDCKIKTGLATPRDSLMRMLLAV